MRTYPRLGEFTKPKKTSGRKCAVCGGMPAGIQWIEVNWFRGEDEHIAACDNCRKHNKEALLAKWAESAERRTNP